MAARVYNIKVGFWSLFKKCIFCPIRRGWVGEILVTPVTVFTVSSLPLRKGDVTTTKRFTTIAYVTDQAI